VLNEFRAADLEPHDVLLLLVALALVAGGALGLVWLVVWFAVRLVRG